MINSTIGGCTGFIVFLLDIWAIVNVIRSDSTSNAKIGWTVLIIVLPVIGLIAWAPPARAAIARHRAHPQG